jgi:hypothetical protein
MDYILTLSRKFPNVQATCFGDPETYDHIIWEDGDPLPSEEVMQTAWLQVMKDLMWESIKGERDRRKAGGVKVGNYWFHSDDTSRIQQIALVMLGANIPAGLQWKTMDGTFTTMTQTLAGQIFGAIVMSDQNVFAIAEQKKAAMETLEDPLSYDYLSDWPIIYGEQ